MQAFRSVSRIARATENETVESNNERRNMKDRDLTSAEAKKALPFIWHDGKEVPHTGRIMFESTHGGFRFAYYRLESDRFDSDDECYYSGKWEHCDVKRWVYEEDLLML